ncbi:MAG: FtsQ-type POTRA domain-containing protein [Thiobacillaceae bacterium]|nr:FtsQ-type POTRA domain-containing protein [Thiobacillaceae bacterium]MDW8322647.1 FtsQ-type POTRA domain-containing protein [Burkholderiales bacterium]
MWDDPQRLDRLSLWLLIATGVFAGVVLTRHLTERLLPLREVTVLGARQADTRQAVPAVVRSLRGGFFTLDLEAVRQRFEGLPWVRTATVRRIWPDRLTVELSEHVPVAAWNGRQMLDVNGVLFPVRPWAGLPRIHAPEGSQRLVARRLAEFQALLAPAGWRIDALQLSPRGAWRLTVEAPADGGDVAAPARVRLELGRERLIERIRRFVAFYPSAAARLGRLTEIDLRYPNGFAARLQKPEDNGQRTGRNGLRTEERGRRMARQLHLFTLESQTI